METQLHGPKRGVTKQAGVSAWGDEERRGMSLVGAAGVALELLRAAPSGPQNRCRGFEARHHVHRKSRRRPHRQAVFFRICGFIAKE
jgi:hypothetical protein